MNSYFNNILFFALLLFLIFVHSCKDEPIIQPSPPPIAINDTLTITITDVTHRSLSVNVQSTMNNVQSLVRLYRLFNSNETLISEFPITVQDTTIIDDDNGTGLQLNTNYFYYAVRIDTLGERKDSSNIAEAVTLDTTSHNYTWQEFVIGDGFNNALYDVWGTDENNVWAAGTVILNDTAYGVLKWNGTEWIPNKRIGGVRSIFGFNNSDIWAVGEGAVEHYNGTDWIRIDAKIENGHITVLDPILFSNNPYTSVWGINSSNLYLGNAWGKIIHWDGSKATDLGISDDNPISDIRGFASNDIYAVAGYNINQFRHRLYHFDGSSWQVIKEADTFPTTELLAKPLHSIYGTNSKVLFLAGRRIYRRLNGSWIESGNFQNINVKIRGSNSNNIVAVGTNSLIHHYNGLTWQNITPGFIENIIFRSVYVTENKIFCVGTNTTNAIILIGTRN